MIPEQKAWQLVDRFRINVHLIRYGHDNHRQTAAIVAAYVCVDEIIATFDGLMDEIGIDPVLIDPKYTLEFWKQVSEELKKNITWPIQIVK